MRVKCEPIAWVVHYGSAGCLPDTSDIYPSRELASCAIVADFDDVAFMLEQDGQDAPIITGFDVVDNVPVQDPTPGSLYAWTLEPMGPYEAFDAIVAATGAIDHSDADSAYFADDVDIDYATDARSRLSWHLVDPSRSESGEWSILEVRERYEHADGCSSLDGCVDACTESVDTDTVEHDLYDVLETGQGFPFH